MTAHAFGFGKRSSFLQAIKIFLTFLLSLSMSRADDPHGASRIKPPYYNKSSISIEDIIKYRNDASQLRSVAYGIEKSSIGGMNNIAFSFLPKVPEEIESLPPMAKRLYKIRGDGENNAEEFVSLADIQSFTITAIDKKLLTIEIEIFPSIEIKNYI